MCPRRLTLWLIAGLILAFNSSPALAQDAQICLDTAYRMADGATLDDAEKRAAHEACVRALAMTSSVVQKYQLQEADFDIMGTRPKN